MKSERKLVMAKIETVPGTEAVPAAASDSFMAIDFKWGNAAKSQTDQYEYANGGYGSRESFMVNQYRECSFDLPVMGGGTPLGSNYPAPILALYRACGHAAVVVASTSVTFNPISAGEEAATLYINEDGYLRKMIMARGSMKWMFAEGKVPRASASLLGLYNTPTDVAMPSPTFPTLQKPVGYNKANTALTLGALTLRCKSVELDEARTHSYRNLSNVEDIVPSDCRPMLTLSFELPTAAQKNVYQDLETTLTQAFAMTHGTVAGNRFAINAARAQLVDLNEEKDRGVIFVTAKLELLPSSAQNDQYAIQIT